MHPIARPAYAAADLFSALNPFLLPRAREHFKAALREYLGIQYISLFSYARIGLYCALKALGVEHQDILVSSYTCVVVPQEISASGNRPKFIEPDDGYLASHRRHGTDEVEVVTHLFGQEVDLEQISRERRFLIEDSCLSWRPKHGQSHGDIVLYSLNLAKQVTTLNGGVVATDDLAIHRRIKQEVAKLRHPGLMGEISKLLSLWESYFLYQKAIYTLAHQLKRWTGLSNPLTYSLDTTYRPKDAFIQLSRVQCLVGLRQVHRLPETTAQRRRLATLYYEGLQGVPGIRLPDPGLLNNPSHFLIRCDQSNRLRQVLYRLGVNTGNPIDYTCASLPAFADAPKAQADFSSSQRLADTSVALPFYVQLSERDIAAICARVRVACRSLQGEMVA